jgi:hypothetical protein
MRRMVKYLIQQTLTNLEKPRSRFKNSYIQRSQVVPSIRKAAERLRSTN